jgi:hypothetical protein
MGFFSGSKNDNFAVLPGAINSPQRSGKFGGGTLYRGPLAYTNYTPEAARATSGIGDNAQKDALRDLSGMASNGWTQTDMAMQGMQQRQADASERSQRAGIQQQAAMRGQGGGGLQFAGALAAQQGGADRARDSATQIGVQGAQNRASASQALFGAGSQLEGQAVARGAATDAFNEWASGRESAAIMQAYENASGVDETARKEESDYWNRLAGIL